MLKATIDVQILRPVLLEYRQLVFFHMYDKTTDISNTEYVNWKYTINYYD